MIGYVTFFWSFLQLFLEENIHIQIHSGWNGLYVVRCFSLCQGEFLHFIFWLPWLIPLPYLFLRASCINWAFFSFSVSSNSPASSICTNFVLFSVCCYVWPLNNSVPQISPFISLFTLFFSVCLRVYIYFQGFRDHIFGW